MQIKVITKGTATCNLTVQPTTLILEVKQQIQTALQIPVFLQTIVYQGNICDDTKTVQQCGIPEGATVVCMTPLAN